MDAEAPAEQAADAEQPVCHCFCVPRTAIAAAVAQGARSVDEVAMRTRCCTGCGTCRPDVAAVLRELLPGVEISDW